MWSTICSLIFMCAIGSSSLGVSAFRKCPNVKPVPVDEHFLFKMQPAGGFYVPYSSGEERIPNYASKRMNTNAVRGPHALCLTTKVKVSGNEMLTAPPTDCTYKRVSALSCETPDPGPAGVAFDNIGVHIPKYGLGVVADTDNKTFIAFALCLDGAYYQWNYLTIEPNDRRVRSSTAKALFVTAAEMKAPKRIQIGRVQFERGACSSSAKLMAGVSSVRDSLTGVFG